MALITLRRFSQEAVAQMAVDILKQQHIPAHLDGSTMDIGDALNEWREPFAVMVAEEAQAQAEEILADNKL